MIQHILSSLVGSKSRKAIPAKMQSKMQSNCSTKWRIEIQHFASRQSEAHQLVPQIAWFPLILSTINQKLRKTDILNTMLQPQPPDRQVTLRGCPRGPTKPPSRQHMRSPAQDVAKTKSYLGSCIAHHQSKLVDHLSLGPFNQRIFQTFLRYSEESGHGPASNPSKFTKMRPTRTRKSPCNRKNTKPLRFPG